MLYNFVLCSTRDLFCVRFSRKRTKTQSMNEKLKVKLRKMKENTRNVNLPLMNRFFGRLSFFCWNSDDTNETDKHKFFVPLGNAKYNTPFLEVFNPLCDFVILNKYSISFDQPKGVVHSSPLCIGGMYLGCLRWVMLGG